MSLQMLSRISVSPRTAIGAALLLCCPAALAAQQAPMPQQTWTRAQIVARIAALDSIHTPEGIEVTEPVPVNGTTQWISIRGLNRANPVLLVLHGGPGAPMMPSSWAYQKPWEDFFTVVNWDQRGVGKSFSAADSARLGAGLSNAQSTADGIAIVNYVRKRLGKEKVILLGYSWGTEFGPLMAQQHPELFHAYVGVGQAADDGEAALYDRLVVIAKHEHNDSALAQLRTFAPYPDPKKPPSIHQMLALRQWAAVYDGGWYGKRSLDLWYSLTDWSPAYTDADVATFGPAMSWAGLHLIGDELKTDGKQPTTFRVPVVILAGRHDLYTPWDAARRYFDAIRAPSKQFVTFERSAHFPMFEEPGRFLMALVTEVRPLAGPPVAFSRDP